MKITDIMIKDCTARELSDMTQNTRAHGQGQFCYKHICCDFIDCSQARSVATLTMPAAYSTHSKEWHTGLLKMPRVRSWEPWHHAVCTAMKEVGAEVSCAKLDTN